jgi:hypothetical protein
MSMPVSRIRTVALSSSRSTDSQGEATVAMVHVMKLGHLRVSRLEHLDGYAKAELMRL